MERKIAELIAGACAARLQCAKIGNDEWHDKHERKINDLVAEYLPSGSGFDNGTVFDFDASNGEKLVFLTSFHHMNDGGYYDGWTEHTVTVKPSLVYGFDLKVSGRNRNQIKDYIAETFHIALEAKLDPAANLAA